MMNDYNVSKDFDDISLISTAREGHIDAFEKQLSDVDDPNKYINRIYRIDQDQQCTLLALACLHGRIDLIRFILEHYSIDLELVNDIYLLDDSREKKQLYYDVTVLWIASSINHFLMVQLLVEHGANVNHTTRTNSTSLRSACFNGNLHMIRYLITHGADVYIAKHNNDTNLAVAVFRQHMHVVQYLIEELGCDVNLCDEDGRSPLFDAVNCGSLHLTKFLLDHGARNFRAKCDQMSPLMWAAEKGRMDMIDIIAPYCTILEHIEAKELLASVLISNDSDHRSIQQGLDILAQMFDLRSVHNLPKSLFISRISIFHGRSECLTKDQFEHRRINHYEFWWIEAILIRERLLGPLNRKYRYSLRYQGAILLDNHDYILGIELLIHELQLCREHSIDIVPQHVRDLISILCEIHTIEIPVPTTVMERLLIIIIDEFLKEKINPDRYLYDLLFLITLVSQVERYNMLKTDVSIVSCQKLYQTIRSIDYSTFVTKIDRSSLLHLCLDEKSLGDEFFIDHVCRYPCLKTAEFLLKCAIDVNITNAFKNTPLHTFTSNTEATYGCAILELVCNHGAHLDLANNRGETALDLTKDPAVIEWFRKKAGHSLKCLCARMIRRNHFPFREEISHSLVTFVEKH